MINILLIIIVIVKIACNWYTFQHFLLDCHAIGRSISVRCYWTISVVLEVWCFAFGTIVAPYVPSFPKDSLQRHWRPISKRRNVLWTHGQMGIALERMYLSMHRTREFRLGCQYWIYLKYYYRIIYKWYIDSQREQWCSEGKCSMGMTFRMAKRGLLKKQDNSKQSIDWLRHAIYLTLIEKCNILLTSVLYSALW